MRSRRPGLSLVEVLLATCILAGLGAILYGTMTTSLRGIAADRVTEAKRRLTLDLLERFCHPSSDIDSLFPDGKGAPFIRQLTIDEAMQAVAIPAPVAPALKATLENGGVSGFTLAWTPGLETGLGKPETALRLDGLWCYPVVADHHLGPRVDGFRVYYVRGR